MPRRLTEEEKAAYDKAHGRKYKISKLDRIKWSIQESKSAKIFLAVILVVLVYTVVSNLPESTKLKDVIGVKYERAVDMSTNEDVTEQLSNWKVTKVFPGSIDVSTARPYVLYDKNGEIVATLNVIPKDNLFVYKSHSENSIYHYQLKK